MKKGVLAGGAAALAVAMFSAGIFAGPPVLAALGGRNVVVGPGGVAGGPGGGFAGGPMVNLTDEERAKVQNMSEEERRAFIQEKMGGRAPAGAGPGRRGGALQVTGEVLAIDGETMTVKTAAGGSQVVYLDDETAVGYAKGTGQTDLAAGDSVIVLAEAEGDNVLSATAVVVK